MRHTRTHTKKMEKEIRKSVSLFYFFPPFSLVLQRQTVKSSSPAGLRKKKKGKKRVGLKSQTAALISHGAISKLVTDGMCWDQARPPPTYFPIGRYLDPFGRRFLSPAETCFTILSPYLSQFWICLSCDDDEQDVQTIFLPEKKKKTRMLCAVRRRRIRIRRGMRERDG